MISANCISWVGQQDEWDQKCPSKSVSIRAKLLSQPTCDKEECNTSSEGRKLASRVQRRDMSGDLRETSTWKAKQVAGDSKYHRLKKHPHHLWSNITRWAKHIWCSLWSPQPGLSCTNLPWLQKNQPLSVSTADVGKVLYIIREKLWIPDSMSLGFTKKRQPELDLSPKSLQCLNDSCNLTSRQQSAARRQQNQRGWSSTLADTHLPVCISGPEGNRETIFGFLRVSLKSWSCIHPRESTQTSVACKYNWLNGGFILVLK